MKRVNIVFISILSCVLLAVSSAWAAKQNPIADYSANYMLWGDQNMLSYGNHAYWMPNQNGMSSILGGGLMVSPEMLNITPSAISMLSDPMIANTMTAMTTPMSPTAMAAMATPMTPMATPMTPIATPMAPMVTPMIPVATPMAPMVTQMNPTATPMAFIAAEPMFRWAGPDTKGMAKLSALMPIEMGFNPSMFGNSSNSFWGGGFMPFAHQNSHFNWMMPTFGWGSMNAFSALMLYGF